MEFRKVLALRGPNIWASFVVLEAWLDLGALKDLASDELPGFNDRLKSWLPTLIEHRCSVGERGGFFERLRRGTYLAHILEHVALELQSLAGTPVGFGRTRETAEDGVYKVALEYQDEDLGRAALETARLLCLAAVQDTPFDVTTEVAKLRELAEKNKPAAGVAAILKAARERRIPARWLSPIGPLMLGQGCRQRRLLQAMPDATDAVSACTAHDNELTRNLLGEAGVPVPAGRAVADAADAWQAAQELGLPVMLRLRYGGSRRGASRALTNQAEVEAAYAAARAFSSSIQIERFAAGGDYRLLVVGQRVVAAVRRDGAGPVDVTDQVHADVAARAIEAARIIGLELAGVDIVAADIARPLEEQGGAVVAVRAKPGLKRHLEPSAGEARPVGQAVVAHLFPEGQNGRIPVVGVTGVNGKTTVTRLVAHLLGRVHATVGMTCTEGIYIGDRRIEEGDCSGPKSARKILQNPSVEAAVVETARGGILREGLGFDRCDVGIVTNIGEGDHLGTADIDTPERLAWVKGTLVWAVAPTGVAVLNASDPLVVGMAEYCRGGIIYFARDPNHPVIVEHRSRQGRAAFVRDDWLILAEGDHEVALLALDRVPLTQGGRIGFHVENTLAAAAAAWSLDVPLAEIRIGLETFSNSLDMAPARFNLLDIDGATIVLDYGHNISALVSVLKEMDQFPHRRRAAVYSAAGDRRNSDIIRQGELLADAFDRVILYEDAYMRGRKDGEIMALFRQGLARGRRVREIQAIHGGLKAIEVALAGSEPGELLLVQPDSINDTVVQLRRAFGDRVREINLDEALVASFPGESSNGLVPWLEIRQNHLGRCVRTTRPIPKGRLILRTWGLPVQKRTQYSIQVDADRHIVVPPPLQLFNHSCEPNCGLVIRRGVEMMEVHALRPIVAGEELTLDYETFEYEIKFMDGPCMCNAPSCRGMINGYKTLPPALREAYGPYIAEYLRLMKAPLELPMPVEVPVAVGV